MKILNKTIDFLGSFGLSCIILFLLLVLVFFGTLEQTEDGLFNVQKKYFESIFLVHEAGGIPIPLPGAYLLMSLLFVNLLVGGIVRLRRSWSRVGILITHIGIAFMLVGSYVTYTQSVDGHLTLYEDEQSNEFVSYHAWEIAIAEVTGKARGTEHIMPAHEFDRDGSTLLTSDSLPFDLRVQSFERNTRPRMAEAALASHAVDGFLLQSRPLEPENERNIAGARVAVIPKQGGEPTKGLLWGAQRFPWAVDVDGRKWAIDLRKRRYSLPFTIHLDKFTRELHPRTQMPKVFLSDVTKIEDGVSQTLKITMNEPLREKGYTLYQASWGPSNAAPGDPLFSTLAVVNNPAENIPLYSCLVISLGLVLHFCRKLFGHLKLEIKRQP